MTDLLEPAGVEVVALSVKQMDQLASTKHQAPGGAQVDAEALAVDSIDVKPLLDKVDQAPRAERRSDSTRAHESTQVLGIARIPRPYGVVGGALVDE